MGRSKWISGLFLKSHEIGGRTWKRCWGIGRAGGRESGMNVPRYVVYTYEIFKNWNNKMISKNGMCSKKIIPLSNIISPKILLCLQNQMVPAWLWAFLKNSSTNLTFTSWESHNLLTTGKTINFSLKWSKILNIPRMQFSLKAYCLPKDTLQYN